MSGGNIPSALGPLFVAAGRQYNIPPQVLAGVADVESTLGSDRSTSSAGAVGLMQFLPSTAASIGVNPYNDRSAIFGAAKLLTQFGYHTNPLRALGAYNGGPGNPQYGYANQVMSEAGRLKPQLARFMSGQSSISAPGPSASGSSSGSSIAPVGMPTATTQFDQAGYQKALNASIAGSFLQSNAKSPFDVGPKTGITASAGLAPLFSAGLTTKAPNPGDYTSTVFQQAQGALQKLAGGTPLNQHPVAFSGSMKGSGYTNPLPGASWGRTDMGVDANLPSGAPIKAIGNMKYVGTNANWFRGQPYLLFQLLDGPQAGKYVYYAEAINPRSFAPGQRIAAGQTIGTYNSGGTGLELGWGSSTPGRTLAQATTGYTEGQVTQAGSSFRNFLHGLGARA